jgi:hypothetical protein
MGIGVGSGQGQVAGTCGYCEELSSSINAGNFLTKLQSLLVSFSRRTLLHGVSKYVSMQSYFNISVVF